jgi:hypothetical protein
MPGRQAEPDLMARDRERSKRRAIGNPVMPIARMQKWL